MNDEKYEEKVSFTTRSELHCCYALRSLNPDYPHATYIGYTNNPRRRIRQHNGIIENGAKKTKKKGPWELCLCVYGFPTRVTALKFEWSWQNPRKSKYLSRHMPCKFSRGFAGVCVEVLNLLLHSRPFRDAPLTVLVASSFVSAMVESRLRPPACIVVREGPLTSLSCYQQQPTHTHSQHGLRRVVCCGWCKDPLTSRANPYQHILHHPSPSVSASASASVDVGVQDVERPCMECPHCQVHYHALCLALCFKTPTHTQILSHSSGVVGVVGGRGILKTGNKPTQPTHTDTALLSTPHALRTCGGVCKSPIRPVKGRCHACSGDILWTQALLNAKMAKDVVDTTVVVYKHSVGEEDEDDDAFLSDDDDEDEEDDGYNDGQSQNLSQESQKHKRFKHVSASSSIDDDETYRYEGMDDIVHLLSQESASKKHNEGVDVDVDESSGIYVYENNVDESQDNGEFVDDIGMMYGSLDE